MLLSARLQIISGRFTLVYIRRYFVICFIVRSQFISKHKDNRLFIAFLGNELGSGKLRVKIWLNYNDFVMSP